MESNQSSPAPQHRVVGLRPYYDEAGITIYHADCAQVLPFLDPVDLLLTDPPYGIGAGKGGAGAHQKSHMDGPCEWDKDVSPQALIDSAVSKARGAIVWGGNYYTMPPCRGMLIWDKKQPMEWFSTAHFEYAWTTFNRNAKAYRASQVEVYAKMDKAHPTQKPLEVIYWCIQQAEAVAPVSTILDPFMGSGTTLVAAKNLGKRAIGIERELKYCEIAVRRLAQQTLFQVEQSNPEVSGPPSGGSTAPRC